jgi:hypothetical protein
MYPTNLLGGPVYPPKPIPSEGIQDETLSLSPPIISPLCSVIETRKNWRRSERGEAIWPLHLEAALLEGKTFIHINEAT